MRYVKTTDEIRAIQSVFTRSHNIDVRTLAVSFETTPEAIAALLPPPLEPTPEALGMAWVSDLGTSTCVGPYQSAALFLRARYQNTIGNYCLSMSVSIPEAVTFGREFYGEPRKHAKLIFERQDEYVWGSVERHEIRFLSLRGRMTESAPASRQQLTYFTFKHSPRPDGSGFANPPQLVQISEDLSAQQLEAGRGELILRDSPHDPVSDIPVSQVIGATYTEGHVYSTATILCEVDPDAFLPFAFAGSDAFEAIADSTVVRAQAARKSRDGRGRWRQPASPTV
ncbi:MAG: acetoacetate decarboxylase family protein [Dehalococcoidia bacterium]